MHYFGDTFYWIALIHPKDAWHGHVLAWDASNSSAHLVTTTEILTEVLNWFAGLGPAGRTLAAKAVHAIKGEPSVQVLPPTVHAFELANTEE